MIKRILSISLICIFVSCTVNAEVVYVEKGKLAPYSGYLFSPEKEKETRLMVKEMGYYKNLSESMDKLLKSDQVLITQQDTRIELYNTQITNLSELAYKNESDSFWRNTLYFTLGAVLTGVIVFGVNKASD